MHRTIVVLEPFKLRRPILGQVPLYLNCRSAAKQGAIDSLHFHCNFYQLDLGFTVETWFTCSVSDAELSLSGRYNVFRRGCTSISVRGRFQRRQFQRVVDLSAWPI